MTAPRPWIVLPHDPIEKLEENLWLVDGALPSGHMRRRMSIARLGDGRLAFHNAVPLDEPAMREIEAWGEPAILLVPNGLHRLDIHAWKARYPRLRVLCPTLAAARVRQVIPVDGHWDALPADPGFRAEPIEGSKAGEAVFIAEREGRASLLFGDTVMNIPHLPGFDGFLFRLLGSTGGPRVTFIARLLMVADRRAVRAHLLRLAELPGLARLVPSHGQVVDHDAPSVLRGVAERL